MRLWFAKHTVAGRSPWLDKAYRRHFDRVLPAGTEVHIGTLPADTYQGPLPERYVRFGGVEALFASWFAYQAVVAEREGFDAFVIGTSQDPGLAAARGLVGIPVLGYGETVAHLAAMLARRFAFVGFIPELEEPIRDNLRRAGLERRTVAFGYTDTGPDAIAEAFDGRPQAFLGAFRAAARRTIEQGAELIIPGEGLPNEILVDAGVTEIDEVPVLDADGLLVTTAEFVVRARALGMLGLPTTGYYHQRPNTQVLQHLLKLYAPRAASD